MLPFLYFAQATALTQEEAYASIMPVLEAVNAHKGHFKVSTRYCENPGETLASRRKQCKDAAKGLEVAEGVFATDLDFVADNDEYTAGCCLFDKEKSKKELVWEFGFKCLSVLEGETDYQTVCTYKNAIARIPGKFLGSEGKTCGGSLKPVTLMTDCAASVLQFGASGFQPHGFGDGCCMKDGHGDEVYLAYYPPETCKEIEKNPSEKKTEVRVCLRNGLTSSTQEEAWTTLLADVEKIIVGRLERTCPEVSAVLARKRRRVTYEPECGNAEKAVGVAVATFAARLTVIAGARAMKNHGAWGLVMVENLRDAAKELGVQSFLGLESLYSLEKRRLLPERRREGAWGGGESTLGEHLLDVFYYGDITGIWKAESVHTAGMSARAAGVMEDVMKVVLCKITARAKAFSPSLKTQYVHDAIKELFPEDLAAETVAAAENYAPLCAEKASTTAPPPPSTTAPTTTIAPAQTYEYLGCFTTDWKRMPNVHLTMTGIHTCMNACKKAGFGFFGFECPMKYGRVHCECANMTVELDRVDDHKCREFNKHSGGHCRGTHVIEDACNGEFAMGAGSLHAAYEVADALWKPATDPCNDDTRRRAGSLKRRRRHRRGSRLGSL